MTTIKAYTDLSQSKVLAEILSLESADMGWYYSCNPQSARNQMWAGTKAENADIPCWSLAALLGVLPNENMLVKTTDGEYYCLAKDVMTKHYDNPVDACVAMIERLHEFNLL